MTGIGYKPPESMRADSLSSKACHKSAEEVEKRSTSVGNTVVLEHFKSLGQRTS
jgi:hypothetical protein